MTAQRRASDMAKTKLTAEQSQAVKAKGMVMVSASAGSGKTHTMLERIMHLIEEGVGLNRMLILVYNEANASELREKIRQKLFEKVCENVGDTAEKYRKQLDEIAFSTICTIHAFCRSIIRTNFEVLGINPDFEILDTTAHEVYMKKAMDEVFNRHAGGEDEVFQEMLSIFEVTRSEDNLRANVTKLYECMDVQSNLQGFVDNVKSYYVDDTKFDKVVFGHFNKIMKGVKECANSIWQTLVVAEQDSYAERMQLVMDVADYFDCGHIEAIISSKELLAKRISKKKKEVDESVMDLAKKCSDTTKDVVAEIASLYGDNDKKKVIFEQNKLFANKLLDIALEFKQTLEDMKSKDNVLSFGDLEHSAVKLIDAGVDVAENYDHVFVDEYQDVNRAQEYVISHLVKDEAFMVGDVKQSIYGFRLSDPEIFLDRQRRYVEGAKNGGKFSPIFFNNNFRSDNQILQFVNGVFESIMTEESAGVDYKNNASFAPVADPDRNEGHVEVHVFQQGESTPCRGQGMYSLVDHENLEQIETALESEGRFIAEEIKRLKGRTMVTVKGEQHLLTYGDFALLFRKRGKASKTIIDQLKKAGIPVDEGTFSKDDVPAESELIAMLNVLDNPRQDYALAGYMLSYLGGYTENEMAKIVAFSHEGQLYDKVIAYSQVDDQLGDKIRGTLSLLEGYRTKASIMGVKELVETLIADTCLDAYLASKGQSYVNGIDTYLKTISPDATSLARYLREYKEGGREEKGRPSGGDKVHVSTFHSYKGLETPVVFLPNADNTKKKVGGSGDLNVESGGCIAMGYYNFDKKEKTSSTISNKTAQILMQDKEYKEEMRLLYVALTRAQKYMYITGVANLKGDSFSIDAIEKGFACESFEKEKSIFNYVFTARKRGTLNIVPHIHASATAPPVAYEQKPFLVVGEKSAFEEELEGAIRAKREYVYPHQEETALSMKYTVTQINSDGVKHLDPTYPVYEDDEVQKGVSAAAVGTVYHKVMEHIDFALTEVDEVQKAVDQMVEDGVLTADERALVKDGEVHGAIMNDVIKSAVGAKCYHEQPFMMYVPAKDVIDGSTSTDEVLVQGVIDLLVVGKSNFIVDFKYTTFRTEESKEKYKKQLYLYKMAFERAFCEKIEKVVLLSLKTGESFEI